MYSIAKNKLNVNQDTYVAFINVKKAFDFVDGDLMLFKLLKFKIEGKLYRAIKGLYNGTLSCINYINHLSIRKYISVL